MSTPELYSGAVSRDLFTEPSKANDPDPPPLHLETQGLKKPWYQSSLDTNQPKPQRESAAIKFLQKAFKQTGPERSKLMKTIPALQYYRFRVLHLQHHYWNLVDLAEFIPMIRQKKMDFVKSEIAANSAFSVIFDGSTRLGEALAIIVRFIEKDWNIQQRLLKLEILAKSMNAEELA